MARRPASSAFAVLLVVAAALTIARPARAWVEMHVANDDVRVAIDRNGRARVEHRITIKISGGPLRGFDIVGVDDDAAPLGDGFAAPSRDVPSASITGAVPITLELVKPPPTKDGRAQPPRLRVHFAQERGLLRGVYTVVTRYDTDLAARGLITHGGAMARVRWKGAMWEDGLDSARATFAVPAAATEPRPDEPSAAPSDAEPDDIAVLPPFLSNIRRGAEQDEIDLVRPYAPKGLPIVWSLRVDPRAIALGASAASPASMPPPDPELGALAKAQRGLALAIAAAIFVAFGLLVAFKFREAAARASEAGAKARPMLVAPLPLRAALASLALVSGMAFQLLLETATVGALLVASATLLAAHRSPVWPRARGLRRPGQWLPLADADGFAAMPRPRGALWDASTWLGRGVLALLLALLAGGVLLLARTSAYYAILLGLDAAPLLAIFCTGRLDQLPPDPSTAPSRFLARVAKRVRRACSGDLKLVPRIHVPDGSPDADELRLAIVPRNAIEGFVAIEVGVTYVQGGGGCIALPEVLLRLVVGSACEKATGTMARHGRATRGRKPNERVIALSPKLPTTRMTATIAATLAALVRVEPSSPPADAKAREARPTRSLRPRRAQSIAAHPG